MVVREGTRNQNPTTSVAPAPTRVAKERDPASDWEKVRLLKAADAALASGERGALEAFMRKEGLYSSHLASWRATLAEQGAQGLAAQKPGRKPKLDSTERQLLAAQKENARLKRKLELAQAGNRAEKKKAHQVLGLTLPELGRLDELEEK